MREISITYYGHSCFKISNGEKSVLFDPYEPGSVPGLSLPSGLYADALYCSHEHADHNARSQVRVTGSGDPFPMQSMLVPHDEDEGRKRGMSRVVMVDIDGVKIAHLGDYGRIPSDAEYDFLRQAQVLLVPCGGFYTIAPTQARSLIHHSSPKLAILMHYRRGGVGYDVLSDITQLRTVFHPLNEIQEHTLTFFPYHIPSGICTLQPRQ